MTRRLRPALLAACLPILLAAQPAFRPGGRRGGPPPGAGPLLAQVHQLRLDRIQETLALPPDRARALADRWARFDQESLAHGRQISRVRAEFNTILMGQGTEDEKSARLRPLLDEFLALRAQQQESRRRFEEDARAGLSPAQQVRFILLVEDLHQRLVEGVRENRLQRRGF